MYRQSIWKWPKEQLAPEELNRLLLAQHNHSLTALHVEVWLGNVKFLDKLWDLTKEVLNRDELITTGYRFSTGLRSGIFGRRTS
jgi:hypothetical protein